MNHGSAEALLEQARAEKFRDELARLRWALEAAAEDLERLPAPLHRKLYRKGCRYATPYVLREQAEQAREVLETWGAPW